MNSPPKRQSPRGGGLRRSSGQQQSTKSTVIPSRRQGECSVVIVAGDRRTPWDRNICREYGAYLVRQLRSHGFDARLEPPGVQR